MGPLAGGGLGAPQCSAPTVRASPVRFRPGLTASIRYRTWSEPNPIQTGSHYSYPAALVPPAANDAAPAGAVPFKKANPQAAPVVSLVSTPTIEAD